MRVPIVSTLWSGQKNKTNEVFVHTVKSSNSKILLESFVTSETSFNEEYGFNELSKIIDFNKFQKHTDWPISDAFAMVIDILDIRFLRGVIADYVSNYRLLSNIINFYSVGKFGLKVNKVKSILYVTSGVDLNNLIKLISLCVNVDVENLTIVTSPTIQEGFEPWSKILFQSIKFYSLSNTINYAISIQGFPTIEKINSGIESVPSRTVSLSINFKDRVESNENKDLFLLNNSLDKDHFELEKSKVRHLIEVTDLFDT